MPRPGEQPGRARVFRDFSKLSRDGLSAFVSSRSTKKILRRRIRMGRIASYRPLVQCSPLVVGDNRLSLICCVDNQIDVMGSIINPNDTDIPGRNLRPEGYPTPSSPLL